MRIVIVFFYYRVQFSSVRNGRSSSSRSSNSSTVVLTVVLIVFVVVAVVSVNKLTYNYRYVIVNCVSLSNDMFHVTLAGNGKYVYKTRTKENKEKIE